MILKSIIFYFKFGNKNLWRRKSRSILLGLSFSLLGFFAVVFLGYSEGIVYQTLQKLKDNFLGDVVIYSKDSRQALLWPKDLKSFDFRLAEGALRGKRDWELRKQYRMQSFLYSGEGSAASLIIGVDSIFRDRITILQGSNLSFESDRIDANEILLPEGIYGDIGARIGESVFVEVVTVDGRRNVDSFTVKGVYRIIGLPDIFFSRVSIAKINTIQRLANDFEYSATDLIVRGKKEDATKEIIQFIDSKPQLAADLVVKSWREYGSLPVSVVMINVMSVWIMLGLALVVIAVFLFDTLFAIVEERKREYGIMMSLGLGKSQIAGMLFGEMAMLTLYFSLPGIVLGGIAVGVMSLVGIPVPEAAGMMILGGYDRVYPIIGLSSMLLVYVVILLVVLFVTQFFVGRINNLNPVEVLRNE